MAFILWIGVVVFLVGFGLVALVRAIFRPSVPRAGAQPRPPRINTDAMPRMEELTLRTERTPDLDLAALERLFIAAWGSPKPGYARVLERSFTQITLQRGDELIGFMNVAWDGGSHFFLLDTTVHPDWRGKGVARRMVEEAIEACRGHGEWLHVDAPADLVAKLYRPCGFKPTAAGVIDLRQSRPLDD